MENIDLNDLTDQEARRREELALLEQNGFNPYPYSFDKTHSAKNILETFSDNDPTPLSNVSVAGRIMSFRRMGKATFCDIQDET
jgi:lysyl-tRNA synthetase class 2